MTRRVLHTTDTLLGPTETFIKARLRGQRYQPALLGRVRHEHALPVDCPSQVVPAHTDPEGQLLQPVPGARLLALMPGLGMRLTRQMDVVRLLRQWQPDVVHAHFGTHAFLVDRACRLLDIPLVVSFYGFDVGAALAIPGIRAGYNRMLPTMAAATGEGPSLCQKIADLGVPPQRIHTLPLALAPWAFESLETLPGRRDPHAPLQVLQVARFVEKKGLDLTIRACALAREAGVDLHLHLVGDGPLRQELEQIARADGPDDWITWHGFLPHDELPNLFQHMDVFMHPSRIAANGDTEGGAPTVIAEAQACGLPVIGSTHADLPFLVADGQSGWLVPEEDLSGLVDALQQAASDCALCRRYGAEGRRLAHARHDPVTLLRQQEDLYDLVVAG